MLIRREHADDLKAIDAVHSASFAGQADPGAEPVEVGLVRALRADDGWVPALSLVAEGRDGSAVGHVIATTASLAGCSAVGLGPIGVLPDHQGNGVGGALMHALLGGSRLTVAVVVLLGHTGYYPRLGFEPAAEFGIVALTRPVTSTSRPAPSRPGPLRTAASSATRSDASSADRKTREVGLSSRSRAHRGAQQSPCRCSRSGSWRPGRSPDRLATPRLYGPARLSRWPCEDVENGPTVSSRGRM